MLESVKKPWLDNIDLFGLIPGQVSDKVNIKNLKRKHSLEREYTDREKNSTGPTRRKSYPMRQRKQLPGIRYDDAISAVIGKD